MGLNDIVPPHVTPAYLPVGITLFTGGGVLYTVLYYLMARQSLQDRAYAMPLLALGFNVAWEGVFLFYVSEDIYEKVVYALWILLDMGIVYSAVKHGPIEWTHAPAIARNLGKIITVIIAWWGWLIFAMSSWWLNNNIGRKTGILYRGAEGPDPRELGFWTALFGQVVLSCTSLAQILARGNGRGTSYAIWFCRFFGSAVGLNANYLWLWWAWPEGHGYVMNPVAICFMITWVMADLAYLYVLRGVKKTEVVLESGRKVKAGSWHMAKKS